MKNWMRRLALALAVLIGGCAEIAPTERYPFPGIPINKAGQMFSVQELTGGEDAPERASRSADYPVAHADVMRVLKDVVKQMKIGPERYEDEQAGVIYVSRFAQAKVRGFDDRRIPYRLYYAIAVVPLGERQTGVRALVKGQGYCGKVIGATARAINGALSLGMSEFDFEDARKYCEAVNAPHWERDDEETLTRIFVMLRSTLLSAGLM